MNTPDNDYGLWGLGVLNSAIFVGFAYSFFKPTTLRDWRSFGAYSGFIVALFAEMYGFPLTIYLLSGWLGSRFPGLNPLSHNSGHLWHTLLGLKGDAHSDPLHILSNVFLFGGLLRLHHAHRPERCRSSCYLGWFLCGPGDRISNRRALRRSGRLALQPLCPNG